MATLFKPTRAYPLPSGAEITDRDGKPHVRQLERGRAVYYPLTDDGRGFLKPAAKWAAWVRHADGSRKRVYFSPNKDAAAVMLADLLKRVENEKGGVIDRTHAHRKHPIAAHLDNWLDSLRANGRDETYIGLKAGRVRAVVAGCGWVFPGELSADRLETFLASLRSHRPNLTPIPPGVNAFTLTEVCRLFAVWSGVPPPSSSAVINSPRPGRGRRGDSRWQRSKRYGTCATAARPSRLRTITSKPPTSSPGG